MRYSVKLVSILLGISLLLGGTALASTEDAEEPRGVVVEEVGEGSALAKAGMEPGDVLLWWRRLAAPPANPEEASGEFRSAFDWMWVVIEQAPRGTVEIVGRRSDETQLFLVTPGQWEGELRPSIPAKILEGYIQGQRYFEAGQPAQGANSWGKLAAAAVDWHLRCWMWLHLGQSWGRQREFAKSHEAYLSAIEEAREPFSESLIRKYIGDIYLSQSNFGLARDAYSSARDIEETTKSGVTLWLAENFNNLGKVAYSRGEINEADGHFQHALEIRQQLAPGSLGVAESMNNAGIVADSRGDLYRALHLHQHALGIRRNLAPNSLDTAESQSNLGVLAWQQGDLDSAMELYRSALGIWKRLMPESLYVASGLNNAGIIASERGDLDQAMDYHQRALEIRGTLVPGSLDVAQSLNNLGFVAWIRGDLARAADLYQRALDIQQELAPNSLYTAESLNNLGAVATEQGDMIRAEDFYQKALKMQQEIAPNNLNTANTLDNLAFLYRERRDIERATKFYRRALDIRQKMAPDSLVVADSLNKLGVTAEARGNLDHAIDFHQRALDIQRKLAPESISVAGTLHALGLLYYRRSPPQLAIAESFLHRALLTLEGQLTRLGGSHAIRVDFRSQYDVFYRDALEVQLKRGEVVKAFSTLEASRARSFLEHLVERDTVFDADIPEDLDRERRRLAVRFDQILDQLGWLNPRDHAGQIEQLLDKLRQLRDEARDIEDEIRRVSSQLVALQYPQPLNLEAALSALDPGTLMLSYSVGEESTILFAVSKQHDLRVETLTVSEEQLRDQIRELLGHVRYARNLNSQRMRRFGELARSLHNSLIEPVTDRIEESERLLILPDGPLHYLPWGALIRETPGGTSQYLLEWKPLDLVLSATVYAELRKLRRGREENPSPVQLVAFGDPRYPASRDNAARHGDVVVRSAAERGHLDLEPLPHTRSEVEGIASLYAKEHVHTYLGEDATEQRAKSIGKAVRIVHFATHGYVDERFPLNSFLALTIPEQYREGYDNGLLQAWEIFERVRLDADLVVLSACETALGDEQGGEGLIGLTRAFQYAGARTVAASLWRVADFATAQLMTAFYRHLKAGASKDEALRAAQMELIHGEDERLKAPYFWAAFQTYGDWQ